MSFEDCIDVVRDWVIAQGYLTTGFVDRGDPAAVDYHKFTLIRDNAWHTLDLSSIVPEGAKAVALAILLESSLVERFILFRTLGNANEFNLAKIRTQVANIIIENDLIVAVDTNRKIEYKVPADPWTFINITVKGWWL